jgi:hypothetical protein
VGFSLRRAEMYLLFEVKYNNFRNLNLEGKSLMAKRPPIGVKLELVVYLIVLTYIG